MFRYRNNVLYHIHIEIERRLSVDWNKIKAEYIAGGTSYRKLAEKYEVKLSALRSVAERENWVELKAQAQHKTNTKIVNCVSDKNAKIDDTYYRCVDKLMSRAEGLIDATPIWQPQTLKDLATALKYLKECRGVKSEADIREQEARIAKLQKEAQEETKDNGVQIIIAPDAEDYSV